MPVLSGMAQICDSGCMNHFAHLYLAQATIESRVGNLLGDFARGVEPKTLPAAVQCGLANHRAVDAYTDRHPLVRQAKTLFSDRRRRFAGVALDVLFDHYLIRHWTRFAEGEQGAFVQAVYRDLGRGQHLMPANMQQVTTSIITHDWFASYASLDNIGHALDRVAGRIRFSNPYAGMIDEIRPLDSELESLFLEFFPELVAYVQDRKLESAGT